MGDEYFFHLKRGLPKWERVGHPLDTLSVLACFLFVLFIPYSWARLPYYIGLCLFSCIFVTKDEFVHKDVCPASEQWLHALLFINHPLLLGCVGLMWAKIGGSCLTLWLPDAATLKTFLTLQSLIIFIFLSYQIIYWNFIWKEHEKRPD